MVTFASAHCILRGFESCRLSFLTVGRLPAFARYHPRPIPSSTGAIARLSEPYFRVEIECHGVDPEAGLMRSRAAITKLLLGNAVPDIVSTECLVL
jgi:hypothetical protein